MRRRMMLILAAAILIAAPLACTAEEGSRSLLVQAGLGIYLPSYPSDVEALFSYVESQPGMSRIKMSLDLAIGFAVLNDTYILARIDGGGDRLYEGSDYFQLNMYLYAAGLRYYPSITGFFLEAEGGASRAVTMSNAGNAASDFAPGFAASVGYDFARSPRGMGLAIEGRYLGLLVEGDLVSILALSLNPYIK
jgi:hypothetical protein